MSCQADKVSSHSWSRDISNLRGKEDTYIKFVVEVDDGIIDGRLVFYAHRLGHSCDSDFKASCQKKGILKSCRFSKYNLVMEER